MGLDGVDGHEKGLIGFARFFQMLSWGYTGTGFI